VLQSSVFSKSDLDSAEPVRCALVGAGAFGSCLLGQAQMLSRRLTVPVICDTDVSAVFEVMRELSEELPTVCENHAAAQSALSAGRTVVVSDVELLRGLPVDIVVAATGIPTVDAEVALHAITEHKHVCMVSKEAESVVGPILAKLAREAGVVCTLVDGDQPSLLVSLLDWCSLLGLEVVCAGKSGEGEYIVDLGDETVNGVRCPGLGALWDINAEDDVAHIVAERSRLVGKALGRTVPRRTEADLGEMGVIANHTNLLPDQQSLHLPLCRTLEVPRLFCPKEDGGLLDSTCLDVFAQMHLVGEPRFAGGVFAVVRGTFCLLLATRSGLSMWGRCR
jgi:predicted homoserine dehydrogenase-like protein